MVRKAGSSTLRGQVVAQLKEDVLAGMWQPGDKLQTGHLSERYGTSSTVVREALMQLAGDHLLQFEPNRGFFVGELTREALRDLTELRCRVEEFGITLAIQRGDVAWEAEVVASLHKMERTGLRDAVNQERLSKEWLSAHRDFHSTLLAGSGFPILCTLAAQLADSTALYRVQSARTPYDEPRNVHAEHRAIVDAVLDKDAALASLLLRRHLTVTIEHVAPQVAVEHPADHPAEQQGEHPADLEPA